MCEIPLRSRDGSIRTYALVDRADFQRFGHLSWSLQGRGRYAGRKDGSQIVLLHREILGLKKGDGREGDHENGDKLDCRRSNLCVVTKAQNMENQTALRQDNRSGYRGVSWHKGTGKWTVQAQVNGQYHYIGLFEDVHEAGQAASDFRREHMPHSFADQP